jgi:hypothetical protein
MSKKVNNEYSFLDKKEKRQIKNLLKAKQMIDEEISKIIKKSIKRNNKLKQTLFQI